MEYELQLSESKAHVRRTTHSDLNICSFMSFFHGFFFLSSTLDAYLLLLSHYRMYFLALC